MTINVSPTSSVTNDTSEEISPKSASTDVCQKSDASDSESRVSTLTESDSNTTDTSLVANKEVVVEDDSEEKKGDQEVVFIQDVGFTIKIVSPGTQSFDIQVSFYI